MPEFSMEPRVPRFLRVKALPERQYALVGQMLERILQLKREGLRPVNLYNCWLQRRLVPLQRRAHPMWKYTGASDPTRSTRTEWDKAESTAALRKILTVPFNSLDEGVPPYTPSGTLAPTVSRVLHMFFLCFRLDADRFLFLL
jgi:hypothetical protein